MIAIRQGNDDIAKLLVSNTLGINVNIQNNKGFTALMIAIQKNNEIISELLVDKPSININRGEASGLMALMFAAYFGNENLVARMLSLTAIKVNAQDTHGWTALMLAVQGGKQAIVQLLLDRTDLNVNLTDEVGMTALDKCYFFSLMQNDLQEAYQSIMDLFKQHGVELTDNRKQELQSLFHNFAENEKAFEKSLSENKGVSASVSLQDEEMQTVEDTESSIEQESQATSDEYAGNDEIVHRI